ncbi:unnamed protein product, partial [Tilletia caries]
WVPILWTVLRSQKEEDFAQHFYYMFECLTANGLKRREVEDKMASVVDFSLAQRNGFKKAYARWRVSFTSLADLSEAARDAEIASFEAHAASLLKGCLFHFHQSVKRVKNNGNFVRVTMQDTFMSLIHAALAAKTEDVLHTTFASLFNKFPECTEWLAWWLQCDTACMIFRSLKTMDDAMWDRIPTSTSALENMHSIYYLCWETNMDLITGLQCLQELAELLEDEYAAEKLGIATRYKHQADKRQKGRKRTAADPSEGYENDGRAPDSTADLKKGEKAQKAAEKKLAKEEPAPQPDSETTAQVSFLFCVLRPEA